MEQVYRHWTKRLVYSEGVKHMAETAGAYWLLDVVASHQPDWRLHNEEFQVWKLSVNPDRTARVWCEDGNDTTLLEQLVPFTDYPEDECEIWLVKHAGGPGTDSLAMLPSEY